MNHISQRNRLEQRLKNYINFMPMCPRDSVLKLSNEIIKTIERIEQIKCMSIDELIKPVDVYFEVKQSKLNFKTV
jgi:hypothetical protein